MNEMIWINIKILTVLKKCIFKTTTIYTEAEQLEFVSFFFSLYVINSWERGCGFNLRGKEVFF